jgi:hypothetical protein
VSLASGEEVTVRVAYRIPDAVSLVSEHPSFAMTFLPHAAVRPDVLELTVIPPYGFDARTMVDGLASDDGVHLTDALDQPMRVEIDLGRP